MAIQPDTDTTTTNRSFALIISRLFASQHLLIPALADSQ
jgi:hypothetical protein